jgi:hypothetical protein
LSRIAIVGSCITRDLWPLADEAPADLLYISRTSLPSLFSPPAEGVRLRASPPPPLRPGQHRALVADLTKSALAALVAHRPTHIVFDFVDERFDLLRTEGSFVTHSWELEASGYLSAPQLRRARAIPRLSQACERIWAGAADELAALLLATPLREAKLILHEAQWADRYLDVRGRRRNLPDETEIRPGRPATRSEHNALLRRYQARFVATVPGVHVVSAPDLRLADEGHRWGLSPFHYVPDYYRGILAQLRALGV